MVDGDLLQRDCRSVPRERAATPSEARFGTPRRCSARVPVRPRKPRSALPKSAVPWCLVSPASTALPNGSSPSDDGPRRGTLPLSLKTSVTSMVAGAG